MTADLPPCPRNGNAPLVPPAFPELGAQRPLRDDTAPAPGGWPTGGGPEAGPGAKRLRADEQAVRALFPHLPRAAVRAGLRHVAAASRRAPPDALADALTAAILDGTLPPALAAALPAEAPEVSAPRDAHRCSPILRRTHRGRRCL